MSNDFLKFGILKEIEKKPFINQRLLAKRLDVSLGKINYCLLELRKRGLVKIKNFKKNKKTNYMYLITPKGIAHKAKSLIKFINIKFKEYEELKKQLDEKNNTN